MMRSSAVMAIATVGSKLLGFGKNFALGMVFAGTTSLGANAYFAANGMPNSIWLLIGGGTLNAVLVPAIVRAAKRPDGGDDYISRLLTLVMSAMVVVTALSVLAAPILLTIVNGTQFTPDARSLALVFALWLLPQMLFSAAYLMLGQILNAKHVFGPYTWAPAINNIITIAGAVLFLLLYGDASGLTRADWTWDRVAVLGGFTLLGSVGQVVFLLWFVRRTGLKLRFRWGFRGLGFRKLGRIGLWSFAMLLLGQLAVYATRWSAGKGSRGAAAAAEAGQDPSLFPGIASVDMVFPVFMLAQSIIAVSVVTAVFPTLSKAADEGDEDAVRRHYTRTARVLAVPMVFATIAFSVLAAPVMWVATGGSSRLEGQAVGLVLVGYMIGLVPLSASYLIKRVYFAHEDARTPFLLQIPNTAVGLIGAAIVLATVPAQYAAASAAVFSSAGNFAGWFLGVVLVNRTLGNHSMRPMALLYAKLIGAGAVSGVAGWLLLQLLGEAVWENRVTAVLLGGAIGAVMLALYAGVCLLLRVRELGAVVSMVRRRAGRGRRA